MSKATIKRNCVICGVEYMTRNWQLQRGWGYTCGSRECRNESQRRTWRKKNPKVESNPKLKGWGYA